MSVSTGTVTRLIPAQRAIEGDGFVVRRPFPTSSLSHIDPFLLFDHMGPVDFAPGEGTGTPWHPHRGFETVTCCTRKVRRPLRTRPGAYARPATVGQLAGVGEDVGTCISRHPLATSGRAPRFE